MGCGASASPVVHGIAVYPRVWRTGNGNEYPEHTELSEIFWGSANAGLALGGGGIRATCSSLGVLMALQSLGLLENVRYCSTVSGSTWLNAALSFLPEKFSTSDFIGEVVEPAGLTPEAIERAPEGSFLRAAGDAKAIRATFSRSVRGAVECLCPCCSKCNLRAWDRAVATAYLKPFELQRQNGVMAPPEGTKAYARAVKALEPTRAVLYPMRTGLPFPILNACKKLPVKGQKAKWYPYEFTPLYGGVPSWNTDAPGGAIGGGVVESFGLGSAAPQMLPNGRSAVESGEVVEQEPSSFVPLTFAALAGSNLAYAQDILPIETTGVERLLKVPLGPQLPVWSPADIKSPNNGKSLLADAGLSDVSGLLALLRRGVERALVSLTPRANPADEGFLDEAWWPCLFGLARQDSFSGTDGTAEEMNRFGKVFEEAAFQPLWDRLLAKAKAREPCVVEVTLKVLRNDNCGVRGGYDARVLWVLPVLSASFESQLPPATRDLLHREPKSFACLKEKFHEEGFIFSHFYRVLDKTFPFVPTGSGDYAPSLCSLLAQNTAYNLLVGAGEESLRSLLAP